MDANREMQSPRKRKRNQDTVSVKASEYFISLSDDIMKKMYKCKLCSSTINGTKLHNLSAHLRNVHPEEYGDVNGRKQELTVKRFELLQNIVEMVSVNGRPFSSISDSGFQAIIRKKTDKLNAAGHSINLTNENFPEVKALLKEMAEAVRRKIKQEAHQRALSLLIDIGTKNRRSIFGISVQYMFKGKLRTRSIGMIELLKSHTAEYLAKVIQDRLNLFGINLRQILTITTDNGSNVLKMVSDIDAVLQNEMEKIPIPGTTATESPKKSKVSHSNESADDDQQVDDDIEEAISEEDETTDQEALGELFDNVQLENNETLLMAISKQMKDAYGLDVLWDVTGIKCAAHTLQLVIKDGLKKIAIKHMNVIKLCRKIAKKLRLQSFKQIYEEATGDTEYKTPRLDVETRWCYKYLMVRTLQIFFSSYNFIRACIFSEITFTYL